MNKELQLPELTQIQLLNSTGAPLNMSGVIVFIKASARRKNDYYLGPYWSNSDGMIEIREEDLLFEIDSTHDSGLMDYAGINQCHPDVRIEVQNRNDIERIVHCRRTAWKALLKGEKKRFQSMEAMISIYENSANTGFEFSEEERSIEAVWDGSKPICSLYLKLNIEPDASGQRR
jgi:hypothetical protein